MAIQFNQVHAQTEDPVSVFRTAPVTDQARAFNIKGPTAQVFLEKLFAAHPKKKRKGFSHKFKTITVEGIPVPLNLKIHEGIHGKKGPARFYFHTFKNEKDRTEKLKQISDNEIQGVIIYVSKKDKSSITSDEEAELFCEYLRRLAGV